MQSAKLGFIGKVSLLVERSLLKKLRKTFVAWVCGDFA